MNLIDKFIIRKKIKKKFIKLFKNAILNKKKKKYNPFRV